ncbi:EAL domain-containing protein [Pseudofrankia sp. BMG5.36]|uniref:putative bifunctional diguanylate cyclase/phosphodiesterase n=1 Tax=Pseudofrankia sp. BMG5.36 TaxID=1834512 RepID=UPI000A416F7F|nr:EAL domain-containing protein [Pseudofrankia sp. BMG5.36]
MITIGPPSRRYRMIRVSQILLLVAAVMLAASGFTKTPWLDAVTWPLRNTFSLAVGLLCLLRAVMIRGDRAPWAVLGGGLILYGAATLCSSVAGHLIEGKQQAIAPSVIDAGWLAFYPACYAAVILLLRHRLLRLPRSLLLDALIGLLGVAALTTGLGVVMTRREPELGLGDLLIALVYPLADLLLALLVISVFGLLGRRAGRVWWLLGCGLLCFVAADTVLASQTATAGGFSPGGPSDFRLWRTFGGNGALAPVVEVKAVEIGHLTDVREVRQAPPRCAGKPQPGQSRRKRRLTTRSLNVTTEYAPEPDFLWALSQLLLAFAAWQRQPRVSPARAAGWGIMLIPTVLALTALGILVAGATVRLPLAAVLLAASTVIAALGRAGLTFVEMQRLAESKALALTDDLTNQPNRRGLDERLRAAITRATSAGHSLALLLLDLDRFKLVNDSLGHKVGDEVLVEVSGRIATALRPGDVVARLGGDEFAVLLERTDGAGAQLVADRVRAALDDYIHVGTLTIPVTASIGAAVYPDQAADADELLARADIAMYAAKERHTGVEHYDPRAGDASMVELTLTEALRDGISGDQIEAHFQPKVEIATGRIRSVEALARWNHPDRGLLAPDSFVRLAEHAGLMRPLTTAVLDQSCAQLASWRSAGLDVTAAVNISATDLLDQAFPDHVRGLLAAHGLGADALELELTETTLMLDRTRASKVLTELHDLGVGIAVDDYGTGYSTLAYLSGDFPVDVLKLDRFFVSRLECNDVARKIVRSTVDLAHDLGLRVVAEGVETERGLALLRDFGCDLAQGFFVGEPGPAEHVTPRLIPATMPAAPPVTIAGGGAGPAGARPRPTMATTARTVAAQPAADDPGPAGSPSSIRQEPRAGSGP